MSFPVDIAHESLPAFVCGSGVATAAPQTLSPMSIPVAKSLVVRADPANTAPIYIGVNATQVSAGFPIKAAEDSPPIHIDDSAKVWVQVVGTGILDGTYDYKYTYVTATGETSGSPASASVSPVGQKDTVTITVGPTGTIARNIYRTKAGGAAGTEELLVNIPDNTTTSYTDNTPDSSLTTPVPTTNTTTINPPGAPTVAVGAAGVLTGAYLYKITFVTAQGETNGGTESASVSPSAQEISLTNIPLGGTGVTGRKIYRTAAGGASGSEKLVTTLSDNTTTSYTDNTADTALGAAVPTTNGTTVAAPAAPTVAAAGSATANQNYAWIGT